MICRAPDGHAATVWRIAASLAPCWSMTNCPSTTLNTVGRLLTQFPAWIHTWALYVTFMVVPPDDCRWSRHHPIAVRATSYGVSFTYARGPFGIWLVRYSALVASRFGSVRLG